MKVLSAHRVMMLAAAGILAMFVLAPWAASAAAPSGRLNAGLQLPSSLWRVQWSNTINVLKGVSFVDATHGWAVGEPPEIEGRATPIIVTSNGGRTWKAQASGLKNTTLNCVDFVNRSYGWAVGESTEVSLSDLGPGVIVRTTNGGRTWAKQTLNAPALSGPTIASEYEGMSFISRNVGWLAGSAFDTVGSVPETGLILRTIDAGKHFVSQPIPDSTSPIADVCFVDKSYGWAINDKGEILHTTNGGVAGMAGWAVQRAADASLPMMERVKFFDRRHGAVVGDTGLVLWTKNGGVTWTKATTSTTADLKDLSFRSATTLWVVGEPGNGASDGEGVPATVLKSTNGGQTLRAQFVPTSMTLIAVSFVPRTTVGWAVGLGGVVVKTNQR